MLRHAIEKVEWDTCISIKNEILSELSNSRVARAETILEDTQEYCKMTVWFVIRE